MDINNAGGGGSSQNRVVTVKMNADINQYLQQMNGATTGTNKLIKSLTDLDKILVRIKNSVGKGLLGAGTFGNLQLGADIVAAGRFEQAMANVAKTVNQTGIRSMKELGDAALDLSRKFPVAATEVAGFMSAVTQIGVTGAANIKKYTEAAIELGAATNMAGDQAVVGLDRLQRAFQIPQSAIKKTGSALVELSEHSATSASNIMGFANALQGVASVTGMTMTQLLGLSAAVTSSGADSVVAANAISKILLDMNTTVREGGPSLELYARLIGTTVDQFKALVKSDPTSVLVAITKTIGTQRGKVLPILEQLGLGDTRTLKTLTQIAAASGDVAAKIKTAQDAFSKGTALDTASSKVFDTFFNKLKILKNQLLTFFIQIGAPLLKPLEQALSAGIKMMQLFENAVQKVSGVWKNFDKLMSAIPGWGILKELLVIALALGPTLLMATGAILLFAGSLLTLVLSIRAMRMAGPIFQAFTEGLLGLQSGKLSKALNILPFVRSLEQAGGKTAIIASGFGLLGKGVNAVLTTTYSWIKALFLGSGPLERMGILLHNMMVPAQRLANVISGGLYSKMSSNQGKFAFLTPDTSIIRRAAQAVMSGISTAIGAAGTLFNPLKNAWERLANSIRSASLFSPAITGAQAFGNALMLQAAKFKAAMATLTAPIGTVLSSTLGGVMGGMNTMFAKVATKMGRTAASTAESDVASGAATGAGAAFGRPASMISRTGVSAAETVVADAAPAAGVVGGEELAAASATPAAPFIAVAAAVGGLILAFHHAESAAQSAADAIDSMGSVTKNLAEQLGVQLNQPDINSIQPAGLPGSTPGNKPFNDKDLLALIKYQQGPTAKARALVGQFVNVARMSGTANIEGDQLDRLYAEADKLGLDAKMVDSIMQNNPMGFNFQKQLISSAVGSVYGNKKNATYTGMKSKGAITAMKTITDTLYANYKAGGGQQANVDAMVGGLATALLEGNKQMGLEGPSFFHQLLIQLGKDAGKTGDKGNLGFRGGGLNISDWSGLRAWAKRHNTEGGFQGNLAKSILRAPADAASAARQSYNNAELQQKDVFAAQGRTASAEEKNQKNPMYASLQGLSPTGDFATVNTQGLGPKLEGIVSQQLASSGQDYAKVYDNLLKARNAFMNDKGLSVASSQIQLLDTQLAQLGQDADTLFMDTLRRQVGHLPATDAIHVLNQEITKAADNYNRLLHTTNTPIAALNQAKQRVFQERDMILSQVDTEIGAMTQLVGLSREQTRLEHDHGLQLADNARNYGRQLEDMTRAHNRQIIDMTKSMAMVNNPFERLSSVGPVAGATDLVNNLADQNKVLAKQRHQVEGLRSRGLSNNVIQQLGLNDPSKYLQVDELYQNMLANPKTIAKINAEWAKRLHLSKGFVTDPANSEFTRMQEDFHRNLDRMAADNKRALAQIAYSFNQQELAIHDSINQLTEDTFTWANQMVHRGLNSSLSAVRSYAQHVQKDLGVVKQSLKSLFSGSQVDFATLLSAGLRVIDKLFGTKGANKLGHDISSGAGKFFGWLGLGGGGGAGPATGGPGSNANSGSHNSASADKSYVYQQAMKRWGPAQWPYLETLVNNESSWNPLAKNPNSTAFGLFQFLDTTARAYGVPYGTSNVAQQTAGGLKYIADRYRTPQNALSSWYRRDPHWYASGSVFKTAQVIGVGERGPEAVIPLNHTGAKFMADTLKRYGVNQASQHRTQTLTSVYNSYYDHSMQFHGDITVESQDPREMQRKLEAQRRLKALRSPHARTR